jgi:glycosyltransferase involved in cell wall biosynthesis
MTKLVGATMQSSKLKIVRPAGYPTRFNTPRASKHEMVTRQWLPLHKIWMPLETVLILAPSRSGLITTFNRIPLGRRPFLISFESHLPRLFGHENSWAFRYFTRQLTSSRCLGIIPISQFAHRMFLSQHADSPLFGELKEKLLDVIYPSVPVPHLEPKKHDSNRPLRTIFVGSHFARKGGLAVLLAAQKAVSTGLPIEFHIVSDLTIGRDKGVWTDPDNASGFVNELNLLKLPNVVHHGKLSNSALLELLSSCDISLLPTLSDTFGYSVIESFAAGVPVIGTKCCALPELVTNGVNGYLIDIEIDQNGEWQHLFKFKPNDPVYLQVLKNTAHYIGDSLFRLLKDLNEDRATLHRMQKNAYETALTRFNAAHQGPVLDALYEKRFSQYT